MFDNFRPIRLFADSARVPFDGTSQGTLLLVRAAGGVLVRVPQVRQSRGLHAAVVLRTLDRECSLASQASRHSRPSVTTTSSHYRHPCLLPRQSGHVQSLVFFK